MVSSTAFSFQERYADYQVVEKAIEYLGDNYLHQPSLAEISAHVGISEYHFQRIFTRWAGISPKRFLQYLTKEFASKLLDDASSVLEASFQSGLSGPGRLHDLFVSLDAVTPGEYKSKGAGLVVRYGFHPTPFGECMLALTERGICSLGFVDKGNRKILLDELSNRWQAAIIREEHLQTSKVIDQVFANSDILHDSGLNLLLRGTNFQIKVWEALLRIPSGSLTTYEAVAGAIGNPKAARAVGRAVASNPISYIIPCHRVIKKMGAFGDYHWGKARKKAILGWEFAQCQDASILEV